MAENQLYNGRKFLYNGIKIVVKWQKNSCKMEEKQLYNGRKIVV